MGAVLQEQGKLEEATVAYNTANYFLILYTYVETSVGQLVIQLAGWQ